MRNLLFLFCLLPLMAQAKVNIVTSILPLQQITTAIMQGVDEPELLIKNQHSAHHFAFKPSHFQTLKSADLVIWVDRHFESGFQRIPEILQQSTASLELLRALDLNRQDGHIWYSPELLRDIIEQISASVIKIDPTHIDIYQANALSLQQAIVDWAQYTENQFALAKPQYLLDHDFLVHFQAHFQLKAVATIHDSHDQHGGIQTMQLIEKQLGQSAVKCLLTNEPDVSKIGRNLADKFTLSVHHIGTEESFVDHLYSLTETLGKCH